MRQNGEQVHRHPHFRPDYLALKSLADAHHGVGKEMVGCCQGSQADGCLRALKEIVANWSEDALAGAIK